jgi:hypothetical protein
MMYSDKFVAVVKCQGKILREMNDVVHLPFGSEYSILLKNLGSRRALVKIEIDGREVTGGGLIIRGHQEIELERFLDNDDLNKGYKFKFIQKTEEIQDFRGDKVEDGLIVVEWWFEKEPEIQYVFGNTWLKNSPSYTRRRGSGAGDVLYSKGHDTIGSGDTRAMGSSNTVFTCSVGSPAASRDVLGFVDESPLADEGITVEGSDSHQKFTTGYIDNLELQSHVIVFHLKGQTAETKKINRPLYVDDKIRCKQCGRTWRSSQKYCGGCGARLIA